MTLTEPHQEQFVQFMDRAKKQFIQMLRDEADSILGTCYTDYAHHIDSNVWTNYREDLRKELSGSLYKQITDSSDGHWAKNVRDMIFLEHRDELEKALNQDLVSEIARLKNEINILHRRHF